MPFSLFISHAVCSPTCFSSDTEPNYLCDSDNSTRYITRLAAFLPTAGCRSAQAEYETARANQNTAVTTVFNVVSGVEVTTVTALPDDCMDQRLLLEKLIVT